jgi:hypothetical protein
VHRTRPYFFSDRARPLASSNKVLRCLNLVVLSSPSPPGFAKMPSPSLPAICGTLRVAQ